MNIDVIPYDRSTGVICEFEAESEIHVSCEHDAVIIRANSAGLISLARHLLTLAQSDAPQGSHFHLNDINALEAGSTELILAKLVQRHS
jgi:hypothetical protein